MDDLSKLTGLGEFLLNGHFLLPDGSHSDTSFDIRRVLENPGLIEPLLFELAELLRPIEATHVASASTFGMIVASQVSLRLKLKLHSLDHLAGVAHVDPEANIGGSRMIVVDDYVTTAQQFDSTIRAVRSRGATVVALGAVVAMPIRATDLPIDTLFAALTLDAQVFGKGNVPDWLDAIPVQIVVQ